MRRFTEFVVLCLLAGGRLHAAGAERWYRGVTAHFEVFEAAADTVTAEKKARDAFAAFAGVRSALLELTGAEWNQAAPVRVISFSTEKQFKLYAPNQAATAYAASNQSRDVFAMVEPDPEHLNVAMHQYAHLVLQRAGLQMPLWMSEGLAEVISTVKPGTSGVLVGGVMKDHVEELKSVKWMDLSALTAVNENSPAYNESNRAGQFYAESWALVHMLSLGQAYRAGFVKTVAALSEGKSAAEAWQSVYGKSEAQVYADLQAYVKQNGFAANATPVRAGAEAVAMAPAADMDSGLMLADLLAAIRRRDQASAAYDKLAAQFPESPEVAESRGYLAWQDGDAETARRDFEQAMKGAKDPQMFYHLAMLYHDAGVSGERLIATLEKAVSLKPDYDEARLQLGIAEYNRKNYAAAIAALAPIRVVAPEHAAALYGALGFAYLQTGDFVNARKSLEAGRKWNRTAAERAQSDDLQRYLEGK